MNVSKLVPLLLAAPFLFSAPAYAQIKAGDTEIGVFGQITSDNEAESTITTIGGSFGHFFTDNLEVQGSLSMSGTSDADGNGTTLMLMGGGADLALGGAENKVVPYVGGLLNLTLATLSTPTVEASGGGVTVDLHVGCKFFMTERAAVDLQLRQVTGTVTLTDGAFEVDQDIDRTEFLVGINVYI